MWQADHTQLDLMILDASGKAVRPWLTTVIDDHSRALAGYFVFLGAPSALQTSLSGGTPPECWRVLFDNRAQPAITRLQFALAGINAHINHDLAEAVVATCQATGTTPDFGGPRYDDYTAVNATLETLIETAKHTLNVRLLGDALPPFARLEDTVAGWKVWAARELAWRNAGHLWHLRSSPLMVSTFEEMLDGFTTVIGKGLMVPIPCAP